ncbi:Palmitoyltransferase ZDHHC3 [Orchesella cincta]|uniref:Palmitoyltransferase n=1 Tax=Orchesella cincta TaxID=48709 RepID=A0A1D2MQV9_ORCCI|nr:Palmitoyltransferase ZDHHC3 [Orchesella cincta]
MSTPTTDVEEDNTTTSTAMPSQYSSYNEPVIRSPKFLTLASCSKDPCGIICMFITYSAVFYADYVVTKWIVMTTFVSLWGTFHVVLFNIIVGLLLMAHLRAVFTDPGFVTAKYHGDDDYLRGVSSSQGGIESTSYSDGLDGNHVEQQTPPTVPPHYTLCPRCNIYRPPRAHHCRICKKCIRRMDHHCPWVNNCVGEANQKYFIQFLFYVGLLSAYAIGLVLYTWVESSQQQDNEPSRWHYKLGVPPPPVDTGSVGSAPINNESHIVKQTRILHSVILMLESLLFGLFVLAILIDQFSAIFTDETIVEQHITKKHVPRGGRRGGPKRSKMDLLRDVCGTGHFTVWILPCHTRDEVVFEKRMNEVV